MKPKNPVSKAFMDAYDALDKALELSFQDTEGQLSAESVGQFVTALSMMKVVALMREYPPTLHGEWHEINLDDKPF